MPHTDKQSLSVPPETKLQHIFKKLNCYQNTKEILSKVPIKDNYYSIDIKPVGKALSRAYLAVLEAINEAYY